MNCLNVALVADRHALPAHVKECIFKRSLTSKQITNIKWIESVVDDFVRSLPPQVKKVRLYVTGLTSAVIAVVKSCRKHGKKVLFGHYNRDDKTYIWQYI